jgi:hypothetical protein
MEAELKPADCGAKVMKVRNIEGFQLRFVLYLQN